MTTLRITPLVQQLTTSTRLERVGDSHVEIVDTQTGEVLDKIVKRDWKAVAVFFAKISEPERPMLMGGPHE